MLKDRRQQLLCGLFHTIPYTLNITTPAEISI